MDDCPICGHELGMDDLVQVEEGEVVLSQKAQRPMFKSTSYPLQLFHVHCVLTRLNTIRNKIDFSADYRGRCAVCSDSLQREPVVFRLTLGFINGQEGLFEPITNPKLLLQQVEVCRDCLLMGLGEGDLDDGLAQLGVVNG